MALAPYFQLNPFASYIVKELTNREQNIGMDTPTATSLYKGPLAAWIRVCSNGIFNGKNGFIMNGVYGFEDTFGFNQSNSTILGYDVDGNPHTIPSSELTLKHRPTPGVTGVEVDLQGGYFRSVTIQWQCWSKEQLDYMEAFFMTAGLSIVVEMGWNNYNPGSLFDLSDVGSPTTITPGATSVDPVTINEGSGIAGAWSGLDSIIENAIEESNGNYDATIGIINGWTSDFNEQGGFNCTTTIVSKTGLYSGLSMADQNVVQGGVPKQNLIAWLKENLPTALNDYRKKQKTLFPEYSGQFEDRIFAGRPNQNSTDNPKQYDFDFNNANEYWLNFNFIIDMVNKFYHDKSPSGIETQFDISNSWISAHPNIKSTNGKVLLIPNKGSPTWTNDSNLKNPDGGGATDEDGGDNGGSSSEDQAIRDQIGISQRDDIAQIIVAPSLISKPQACFPSSDSNGYAGKLGALYVNKTVVEDAFGSSITVKDALMKILRQISEAACGMWDFDIRAADTSARSNCVVTIIDKNFIGFKSADDLLGAGSYRFKLSTENSIVINNSFKTELSSAVALQTFYNTDVSKGDSNVVAPNTTSTVPNVMKDRVTGGQFTLAKVVPKKASDPSNGKIRNGTSTPDFYFYTLNGTKYALTELPTTVKNEIANTSSTGIEHTGCMPGATLTMTILGIGGIKFQDYFSTTGLQSRYSDGCVFQVIGIKHGISDNKWTTTLTAGIRPATEFLTNFTPSV